MKNNRRDYDNPNYTPQGAHGQPGAADSQPAAAAGANGADPYAPCKYILDSRFCRSMLLTISFRWWLPGVCGFVVCCYGPTARRPATEHAQASRILIPVCGLAAINGLCIDILPLGRNTPRELPSFHRGLLFFVFFFFLTYPLFLLMFPALMDGALDQ